MIGGGTGWLTLAGNVTPGETIVLDLAIWDVGDSGQDSVALLDGLRWDPEPTTAGLSPR